MTVSENIRRIRKEKGLTQKKLGELCGMNESQIRKYELGTANPKIETVDRIAAALGVNIIEIMGVTTNSSFPTQTKWTPVSSCLPKMGEPVLVSCSDKVVRIHTRYNPIDVGTPDGFLIGANAKGECYCVVAWMELPEAY